MEPWLTGIVSLCSNLPDTLREVIVKLIGEDADPASEHYDAQARSEARVERRGDFRRRGKAGWSLFLLVLLRRVGPVLPNLSFRRSRHVVVPVVHHRSYIDSRLSGNNEGDEVGPLGRTRPVSASDRGPCVRSDGCPTIPRCSFE